ncbi:MAG: excinuclease ABC subunit UvrA [Paludibacteraceae bacterium]|nr:excinuclease ABC subunit UvrA [Paludibacteraceae bacterium]
MENFIKIKNARVHNLKGIDVQIPHNKITVITGLSGSGKSSLAFDTIYAEGQRRYIESLSAYVRQFLGKINKPEVDFIEGIPPAIAIEQRVNIRNPHSTVGSSTEIYDYLRLLFARVGKTYSPVTGKIVKQDSVESVCDFVKNIPEHTKIIILCPIKVPNGRKPKEHLEILLQQGFTRIENNGSYLTIQEILEQDTVLENPLLVIDRLVTAPTQIFQSRLFDSIETAFFEGNGTCIVEILDGNTTRKHSFSKDLIIDGMRFELPSEQMFNFNNPMGACPTCEGFGKIIGIDEHLVIPDPNLSVYQNAVACWRGEIMGQWKNNLIYNAHLCKFPIHRPYNQLSEQEKKMLWEGTPYFQGINAFFQMLENEQYKIQYRVMLARYRGKTTCPDCHGTRLKKEVQWIKVGGKNITELTSLPITDLYRFFETLQLDEHDSIIAERLLIEIKSRLKFLINVGLGYLRLDRPSNTLSGGESQRINLTTSIGSGLVGALYILDEPSIGLHPRDTHLLIDVLKALRDLGNTIVVVEHDDEIIRSADYIVDIGPDAGRLGGEVVFQGSFDELISKKELKISHTYNFLTQKEYIPTPAKRRQSKKYIQIRNASVNNLKNINVKIPLNMMTVVTGVSGSGKSSLVRNVLYESLRKYYDLNETNQENLGGDLTLLSGIEFVDQNPIGKSSRSNPATYLKAFDEIRKLYAEQPLARQMGFTPAFFSTNVEGGRCEECQGEGSIKMEMQFMADIEIECESCHGKKYKQDILEVLYRGKSIFDILDMTINQAIEFFGEENGGTEQRILKKLRPLQDVGLGYIKLGQASSSLSGGENQRVKLASILAEEKKTPTLFLFDEPTVGLHFHDIKNLLNSFYALLQKGHTIVIIEHNTEIIKCADHIIDMGPEGGENGGNIVFEGTPEMLATCGQSYTAKFLK